MKKPKKEIKKFYLVFLIFFIAILFSSPSLALDKSSILDRLKNIKCPYTTQIDNSTQLVTEVSLNSIVCVNNELGSGLYRCGTDKTLWLQKNCQTNSGCISKIACGNSRVKCIKDSDCLKPIPRGCSLPDSKFICNKNYACNLRCITKDSVSCGTEEGTICKDKLKFKDRVDDVIRNVKQRFVKINLEENV